MHTEIALIGQNCILKCKLLKFLHGFIHIHTLNFISCLTEIKIRRIFLITAYGLSAEDMSIFIKMTPLSLSLSHSYPFTLYLFIYNHVRITSLTTLGRYRKMFHRNNCVTTT